MTTEVAPASLAGETLNHLLHFLIRSEIVDERGFLHSWLNPDHPGFVYPEGMGLYLTCLSQLPAAREDTGLAERLDLVSDALQSLVGERGGVGLNGNRYVFDTCMAVTGLLTYGELRRQPVSRQVLSDMASFIVTALGRQRVVESERGESARLAPTWSTVIGASSLKMVIALDGLASYFDDPSYLHLALGMANQVIETCYSDGAFRVFPEDPSVYCHAHCYALEGLWHLRERGHRDTTQLLQDGARSLQTWQNEDGSMFNWYRAADQRRSKVADATSQAVRLWSAVDREGFTPNIERALAFLTRLRSPRHGLYYCAGSRDINSITSIFATQAIDWYVRAPVLGRIA